MRLGKFEQTDSSERPNRGTRLENQRSVLQNKKLDAGAVRKLSDREKISYYKTQGLGQLADNRKAILRNNEGQEGNNRLTKLNSHNFDRLAAYRNWTSQKQKNTKESFAKWSPDAKTDQRLRGHSVLIRHADAGEKGRITHNKGEKTTGEYLSKAHARTPEKRIEHAALPPGNKAERVSRVELARPQNIIIGQAGPQKQFENKGDGIQRKGGTRQMITDGGYAKVAIRDAAFSHRAEENR